MRSESIGCNKEVDHRAWHMGASQPPSAPGLANLESGTDPGEQPKDASDASFKGVTRVDC